MGEAEEEYSAGCSFSLMCQEDSASVFADGELQAEKEDEEEYEYVGHLVSKEGSFCGSPSFSSSSVAGGVGEDWFRCARRDTVKWILEVNEALFLGSFKLSASLTTAAAIADARLLRVWPPHGVPGRLLPGPLLPPPKHRRNN
jgi:hypothetical protein